MQLATAAKQSESEKKGAMNAPFFVGNKLSASGPGARVQNPGCSRSSVTNQSAQTTARSKGGRSKPVRSGTPPAAARKPVDRKPAVHKKAGHKQVGHKQVGHTPVAG